MDIDKAITNPNLVNVIKEMKQGNTEEKLFWEEIFKARFLCPVGAFTNERLIEK